MGTRVFFQHIPKTAGSSLNHLLVRRFGANESETFINGHPRGVQEGFGAKRFLSGHMTYDEVFTLPYIDRFQVVTMFRHPLKLIVSALQWADHYTEVDGHPPGVQNAIRRVWDVDFDDPNAIRDYLADEIDNGQVRYIVGFDAPLADLTEFKRRLSSFAFVGVADRFESEMQRMNDTLGLGMGLFNAVKNTTPARRRIDLTIPGMYEALTARLTLDFEAYAHVLALSQAKGARARARWVPVASPNDTPDLGAAIALPA